MRKGPTAPACWKRPPRNSTRPTSMHCDKGCASMATSRVKISVYPDDKRVRTLLIAVSNARLKSSGLTQDSAPWVIVAIKIVRWIRHWDEKHQPITLPLIEAWLLARLLQ